jgi:hypothetical protein
MTPSFEAATQRPLASEPDLLLDGRSSVDQSGSVSTTRLREAVASVEQHRSRLTLSPGSARIGRPQVTGIEQAVAADACRLGRVNTTGVFD